MNESMRATLTSLCTAIHHASQFTGNTALQARAAALHTKLQGGHPSAHLDDMFDEFLRKWTTTGKPS